MTEDKNKSCQYKILLGFIFKKIVIYSWSNIFGNRYVGQAIKLSFAYISKNIIKDRIILIIKSSIWFQTK